MAAAVAASTVLMSTGLMFSGPANAAPADPAPLPYVNLGDSYSAASGVGPTAPGTFPLCSQSLNNFAHLLARRNGFRLTDVSCGGASTDDFFGSQYPGVPPQLDALTPATRLVTVMIGGNDGSVFAGTIAKCVAAAAISGLNGTPCKNQYGSSIVRQLRTETYPNVVRTLTAVRAKAPGARVFIVSYPWLMPATARNCPGFPIAPGDAVYTYDIQTTLNDVVKQAAEATGVRYVDVTSASAGHDACAPVGTRWVEPLVGSRHPVPVHPNALGQREIASILERNLSGGVEN